MAYGLIVKTKPTVATATALHNNTNSDGPVNIVEFTVEVDGGATNPVYIGGSDVAGASNGITIEPGEINSFQAPDSRGSQDAWDMRCIYYFGNEFKLACVRQEEFKG